MGALRWVVMAGLLAVTLAGCGEKDGDAPAGDSGQSGDGGGDGGGGDAGDDSGGSGLDTEAGTGDGGGDNSLDTSEGTFSCGELTCLAVYEYCFASHSGASKDIDYSCEVTPEACLPEPDCSCLSSEGVYDSMLEDCAQDDEGNLFVDLYLP